VKLELHAHIGALACDGMLGRCHQNGCRHQLVDVE
jgi:hypothetical protein